MNISKTTADTYEREYGFMCINAILRDGQMLQQINADFMLEEMKEVYDILLQRGWKVVKDPLDYELGCQIYGTPKAFEKQ